MVVASNKRFIFLFAPSCYPTSPYISISILSSILEECGYSSSCFDLNAEFHNKAIYNKNILQERFNQLKNTLKQIKNGDFHYTDLKEKIFISKYSKFFLDFKKNEKEILEVINNIEDCVKTLKSKDFYDIKRFETALNVIFKAEAIFFCSFFQSQATNKKIGYKFKAIDYFVKNEKLNPFYSYYMKKINEGFFDNYDYVMISQPFDIQSFGVWTLAYLLKKYTKVKVCIGGNYPSRLAETFKSNVKIFDYYFDYALLGKGEEAIIEFAEFAHNRRNIEQVSGLIYKKQDKIFANPPKTFLQNVEIRPKIKFDGINFKDYLIPEVVIPLQVSNGCPWGKCSFCVFHEGKTKYQIIPAKQIAEEVKYLHDKYGITKFEFADEALTPQYYYEFAKEIIKLQLDIHYYGFARFDTGFTSEILETMYKSGFRVFEWGFETPSKRIMEIFNKGIDIDSRTSILKRANEAKIWNHCLTIVNVPFETKEEILYDCDFYLKNSNIINSRQIAWFALYKKAPIFKQAEDYNMTNIKSMGDLSIRSTFERRLEKDIMEDNIVRAKHIELHNKYEGEFWSILLKAYDEYLFLYVAHYGKDKCLKGEF